MKKLQNNFTTKKQSFRLLELGVPADSADCYYDGRKLLRVRGEAWMLESNFFNEYSYFTPCWSVGRLIEIITICREETYTRLLFSRVDDHTNIENLIHYISAEIENGHMDFSKLEE